LSVDLICVVGISNNDNFICCKFWRPCIVTLACYGALFIICRLLSSLLIVLLCMQVPQHVADSMMMDRHNSLITQSRLRLRLPPLHPPRVPVAWHLL